MQLIPQPGGRANARKGRDKTRSALKGQAGATILKTISGGQTGADRAAFDWAIANKIPHGGWCPRGRLAEDGIIPEFYRMQETVSTEYTVRTERNVSESDGTVIFTIGKELTGGSKDTAIIATRLKKPWMHISKADSIDPPEELRLFIKAHQIKTLNVAGTRASKEPLIADFVKATLRAAFSERRASDSRASDTTLAKRKRG
ncbi:MAG TPA: putative molybdenum carrier protein [Verrucomicrobiae bacterium]|nr:putative molybdenum carrier protein [Verrucomicrobiae bacterium]